MSGSTAQAEQIAASIRDFPGDWVWKHKGHTLVHRPSGFVLWVANEAWALGERRHGVTNRFSKPEQDIVWPAVEGWLAANSLGFTWRLPKAKLRLRDGSWWCGAPDCVWVGVGGSPSEAFRSWSRAVSVESRADQHPDEVLVVQVFARC